MNIVRLRLLSCVDRLHTVLLSLDQRLRKSLICFILGRYVFGVKQGGQRNHDHLKTRGPKHEHMKLSRDVVQFWQM